jgi:hypothetical protein
MTAETARGDLTMSLKNITVVTKTAKIEFPGLPGFVVEVAAISRDVSRRLKDQSEVTKIDPKHRIPVKELDEEKFITKFTEAAIKGWKGLKYKYLPELLLVDLSEVPDLEAEVDFSLEDAVWLVKNSQGFDSWLNEQVFSLEAFRN